MSAILDTCIVSELYDVNAEPAIVQRVNELGADAYLSVITIGELFRGTQLLDFPSAKDAGYEQSQARFVNRSVGGALPFDFCGKKGAMLLHKLQFHIAFAKVQGHLGTVLH